MIKFRILKKSRKSGARLGVLETPHGQIETPTLVPVATQAAVKALSADEVLKTKSQILICNTYHLHLKPGEKVVKSGGGLHKFMNWPKPLMTDSGGFQVFSLGFGKDLQVGKILKYFPGEERRGEVINKTSQPKLLKITNHGVSFRSPFGGEELFLGPKESMKIQEDLGADIIFAFDECTSPLSSKEYIHRALQRTHRWAKECARIHKGNQALFGIVQGSHFKDLREESAKFINNLDFPGFGIGGDLGESKNTMLKIIAWTLTNLNSSKPRHLLGVGHPEDLLPVSKAGMDTFDCIAPTHYARRGIAFTSKGRLDMRKSAFLKDKKPLDNKCECKVCTSYTRSYISHLIKANEINGMSFLTFHNLFFLNAEMEKIREKIRQGKI